MKNILHIFYSGLGGHGNVFFSLIKADEKKKHTVSALLYGIEPPREEYENRFKSLKIPNSYVKKKQGLEFINKSQETTQTQFSCMVVTTLYLLLYTEYFIGTQKF